MSTPLTEALKNRASRALFGERCARAWLERQGFRIRAARWKVPRGWGLGEVDLVAMKGSEIWLCEVKCHRLDRSEGVPVFTKGQLSRQWRSHIYWKGRYPQSVVCWRLLHVDPATGRVECLVNPF